MAKPALDFYVTVFPQSRIEFIEFVGPPDALLVKHAEFFLAGQSYMACDNPSQDTVGFTSALSMYINCVCADTLDDYVNKLAGNVLIPPDNHGFSERYAWVKDDFGVSWQLNYNGPEPRIPEANRFQLVD